MIILFLLLYLCVGAVVTYTLRHLYLSADYSEYTRWSSNNAEYCVVIGVFWLFAAPFAFAMYFAKYGIPESLKKRGRD